jgi:stalled ribosome alternative rescue factor ArfA
MEEIKNISTDGKGSYDKEWTKENIKTYKKSPKKHIKFLVKYTV